MVVGSGPNGLAAAVTLAEVGRRVLVIEAHAEPGGGTRTAELTLPGFWHDVCSAVHPLALASPFFHRHDLTKYGLSWVFSPAALAHPFDDGTALLVRPSLRETALSLGKDRAAYQHLFEPITRGAKRIVADLFGPIPFPPRHPLTDLRFGLLALLPAALLARMTFKTWQARALFGGMAAHAILPLEKPVTSAFALAMHMLAHTGGWPIVRGGSQHIHKALVSRLESMGGEIITGWKVESLQELPAAETILFDVPPRQLVNIAGERLPASYRQRLGRFRYGPGVFKIDWALDASIPWRAAEMYQAAAVHIGATLEEISASERAAYTGQIHDRPYIILSQPTLFDPSRAPQGKHIAWAYCHVPHGSPEDMSEHVEAQIERFAPGFRSRILARATMNALQMESYNPNYIGGDINSGVQDIRQFFTRPLPALNPYATPLKGMYICNSSTPPGGGVHGLCGYHAARAALKNK